MSMRALLGDSSAAPATETGFDYADAFSRNIGWITEWEQQELRKKTIAIAGLGGVGGPHALTLARLGIGGFHIADLDRFETANMNRQAGAFRSTVGLQKTAVMSAMILDINPEARLKVFDAGINEGTLDDFLAGADLFVDGLDFFVLSVRRKVFKRCAELGIPAVTAAPIGFGTSYLVFMPGGMSFEEYFRLEGLSEEQQYVNFALGLTPKGFHRSYLADPSRLDLQGKRAPSSAAAVQLCSGVVGTEVVKLLLKRGKVHAAPACHQFDAYRGRWRRSYLRFGNAGPVQSLKRLIGNKAFASLSRNARPKDESTAGSEIERILDLARWAPSGDNAQPWRFEILGDDKVVVNVRVEGEKRNIYDYAGGQPTLISGGVLLETMRIAATRWGRRMRWSYLGSEDTPEGAQHRIEVSLPKDRSLREDPLSSYIAMRSVDRRPYRLGALTRLHKAELELAIGDEFRIEWRETLTERWKLARLCARSTDIRLRSQEAYFVHRRILDWTRRFSPDGVPAKAVGADPLTLRLMRWAMGDWRRVDFLNRFLAGTAIPQLQLDLIPGIYCGGFFVVTREKGQDGKHPPDALLRMGERLQRFWLTATRLGLAVQPTLAPLCFLHYAKVDASKSASSKVATLANEAASCIPNDGSVLFLGRVGTPKRRSPVARSIRQNLAKLSD